MKKWHNFLEISKFKYQRSKAQGYGQPVSAYKIAYKLVKPFRDYSHLNEYPGIRYSPLGTSVSQYQQPAQAKQFNMYQPQQSHYLRDLASDLVLQCPHMLMCVNFCMLPVDHHGDLVSDFVIEEQPELFQDFIHLHQYPIVNYLFYSILVI